MALSYSESFHETQHWNVRIYVGVVRLAVLITLVTFASLAAEPAKDLIKRAAAAEKEGRQTEAYLLYSQAAAADPANPTLWAKANALKGLAAPFLAAATPVEVPPPADLDPKVFRAITSQELREVREMLPPPLLKPTAERKSFDLRDGARKLFEQVAKAYGYQVAFDSDYPTTDNGIRFAMTNADYHEALRGVSLATGSFVVALSPQRLLVVKDTQPKRQELEPNVAVMLSLPGPVQIQDLQELARAVQQTMELQHFVIDNRTRTVLMRDRVSKVRPAQQMFMQLMRYKAEVEIEIQLMEFSSNFDINYGITLPNRTQLVALGKPLNFVFDPTEALKLVTFGGGSTLIGLSLSSMDMFATMSQSFSKTLLNATIRSDNGMPATLHIGDKYPIISAGYFGAPIPGAGTGDGQTYRPPPTFNMEDLGLTLKITPIVHGLDEISIEVESEFKLLSGDSFNDIPVVSNRKFTSRLRLQTGEWAVMSGLLSVSEARNISGIPGLMQIPVLGQLFSNNSKQKSYGESLVVLRPRLLSLPPTEWGTEPIWTGPEGRPEIPF